MSNTMDENRKNVEFGDELDVIITDPKRHSRKDPITQLDRKIAFVRFPDGYVPETAERATVRVVEVEENFIVTIAQDWENRDQ